MMMNDDGYRFFSYTYMEGIHICIEASSLNFIISVYIYIYFFFKKMLS